MNKNNKTKNNFETQIIKLINKLFITPYNYSLLIMSVMIWVIVFLYTI